MDSPLLDLPRKKEVERIWFVMNAINDRHDLHWKQGEQYTKLYALGIKSWAYKAEGQAGGMVSEVTCRLTECNCRTLRPHLRSKLEKA